MDRHRGDPYRNPRGPPPHSDHNRSPNNYHRHNPSFHSPPPPSAAAFNSEYQVPLTGHKRAFPFSGRGGSPDHSDGGSSFAKLFVGSVPRTCTEEDIRPVFEEHGRVLEVALIKDKRTGLQQVCG